MAAATPSLTRRAQAPVPGDAEPVRVAMRDGVYLATDLYLPKGAGHRTTVLCRLPYDKCGESFFMPTVARWFRERGYAVVVQQTRGKLSSEGTIAPFAFEASDGFDALEWIASQSWSDGSVVMIGDSYCGFTQWAAAASRHPTLKAITPRVTSVELHDDWLSRQGVFSLQLMVDWVLHTWLDEQLYDAVFDWDRRPLCRVAHDLAGRRYPAWADDWARGVASLPKVIPADVPALHMGGWWDIFGRGQMATWRTAKAASHASQYLLLGARDHAWFPLHKGPDAFVDPRLATDTVEAFTEETLLPIEAFFRHILAGANAPPAVSFELTGAGWREASTWPPPEADRTLMYAADSARAFVGPEGGALLARAERRSRAVEWTHDPLDPVPSLIPNPWEWLASTSDERDVEVRDDVLTFSSEPLERDLDLAGPVRVLATVSSSAPSCHLAAKLVVVDPAGPAFRLLDGIAVVSPADSTRTVIDLGDTGYRVPVGHRLRLEVAASCYPRYAVHPGTDGDPWTEAAPRASAVSVVVGGPLGLRVEFSVLV